MGPRSTALMVLLALAALAVAGLILLWPRPAQRSAGALLLRIGLIGALQVSVLGYVFVSVNRSQQFYASWADLLGTSRITGTVAAMPAGSSRPGAGTAGAGRPGGRDGAGQASSPGQSAAASSAAGSAPVGTSTSRPPTARRAIPCR